MPNPHHIIAIGASAGGMEELKAFFDHTPLDGVAYVIIQHLSPDFKSRMVELLARHSKLDIEEAQNGMQVKSNHVYLIPNDKFMTIYDGKLALTEKGDIKGPHLTINAFFNSLAADAGKKAIGIIMSGLGSDGTEGVKAIKKAGGMVIARDPETYGLLLRRTHTVWISAQPEEHMGRVMKQGDFRPMAKNREAMADLHAILESRRADYARAELNLDTSGATIQQSFAKLTKLVAPWVKG